MKRFFFTTGSLLALSAVPRIALAHCPLCTAGAGAAAVAASYLGVGALSIGIFIGAFAVAIGLWFSTFLTRRFGVRFPFQKTLLGLASLLLTVIPLMPLIPEYSSFYLSWTGDYGSLLNRTYAVNSMLLGSFLGALMMTLSPTLSRTVSRLRKSRTIPFQGIILTFLMLFSAALIAELLS
ncbi:hypothetical protein CO046_02595 [Candidatus Peregrinibacteria bacterium CG_4_9_14_0_2_um_filter_53_11]|nr:MAG: hypothetical protein CO046_02595 [Candidatus Peregrinibacteria bacterium CG_4_9_14_0_2_um_filter_53_11]